MGVRSVVGGVRVRRVPQGAPLKPKVGPDRLYVRRLSIPAACGMLVNFGSRLGKKSCRLVWSLWMVGVIQTFFLEFLSFEIPFTFYFPV